MKKMSASTRRRLGLPFALLAGSGFACGTQTSENVYDALPDGFGSQMDTRFVVPGIDASASGDTAPAGDALQPLASQDPAPTLNVPGKYTLPEPCPGCPTSADTIFELNVGAVTSYVFSGTVPGAIGDGQFFVSAVGVPNGGRREVWGPIPTTDGTGAFSFTAPLFCGEQIVKCVWSNAAGRYVLVTRVITTNCVEPDIRVTMSWDDLGYDWELHLIKPGGRINDTTNGTDCTWTTCIGTGPDWGMVGNPADDPRKDVDNTGNFGPENIFLAGPENGRYTVMVEHWGSSGMPTSDGQVIINVRGQVYGFPVQDLASHWVWTPAVIDWPSAAVSTVDTRFDCTGMWSGGCTAPLP